MIAVGLRFISGRFHATPWGRHVNEGAPEWPPSPWRLARALVAAWKRKLADRVDEDAMRRLIAALSPPPEFVLPSASSGHTRHYMPWFKKGPDDRTLIFDSFVATMRDDEIVAIWRDVDMTSADAGLLDMLLHHLGFFGRAESWCDARVVPDNEAVDRLSQVNCRPLTVEGPLRGREVVRVLCLDPANALLNEHTVDEVVVGRGKSKMIHNRPRYEPNWHLCFETLDLHRDGWSDPPGSRWVPYTRRADALSVPATRPQIRPRATKFQVARFALDSRVLPLATDALTVAEQARYMLMGIYRRVEEMRRESVTGSSSVSSLPRSEVFSGKDVLGRPLEGHVHAYYLPTDEDGDGRLDHLTIAASKGFDDGELRALDRFLELRRPAGVAPLRVVLTGLGVLAPGQITVPLFGPASRWVSVSPFIVTRHAKTSGSKRDPSELLADRAAFVAQVLREELARLCERRPDLPPAESIGIEPNVDDQGTFRVVPRTWAAQARGPTLRPVQFKRFRRKADDDGGTRAAGTFRLRFPQPVRGPICLGHSAHFGMGLFLPSVES